MPTYPQVTRSTLEALYRLGINVCDEIEKHQPDVVLGLAHSGWMPVVVAQALWAATSESPFPAATRTNIGLEKNAIYAARYGKSEPAFCCGECCDGPERLSHYLAWAADQSSWLKTLRGQIGAVFPSTPRRILVVDDIFGGYRSGYATLAMLYALYPDVDTYVYAGHNDLTDNFVSGCLELFVPALANEIQTDLEKTDYRTRYGSPWHERLKPLITGTEDIAPDRLDWKFISRDSAAVKALADHIPAEVALSLPGWAETLACSYALERLKGEIKDDEVVEPLEDMHHLFPLTHLSIQPQDRLAARAWQQGGVTSDDIARIYGAQPDDLRKGLHAVRAKHTWHSHGDGPHTIYLPMDSLATWINAYSPAEGTKPDVPVRGFAEFLPGQVWAGVYPMSHNGMDVELFKDLLSTGVNSFIDLTHPRDFHRNLSYHQALLQASRETGRVVHVEVLPLPFRAHPARQQVQQVIMYIDGSLKKGQRIYIHAGYNLEGRTPMILACLLIRRGYAAEKALAEVDAFWSKTLHFLIRSPLSDSQREFILNW